MTGCKRGLHAKDDVQPRILYALRAACIYVGNVLYFVLACEIITVSSFVWRTVKGSLVVTLMLCDLMCQD